MAAHKPNLTLFQQLTLSTLISEAVIYPISSPRREALSFFLLLHYTDEYVVTLFAPWTVVPPSLVTYDWAGSLGPVESLFSLRSLTGFFRVFRAGPSLFDRGPHSFHTLFTKRKDV